MQLQVLMVCKLLHAWDCTIQSTTATGYPSGQTPRPERSALENCVLKPMQYPGQKDVKLMLHMVGFG